MQYDDPHVINDVSQMQSVRWFQALVILCMLGALLPRAMFSPTSAFAAACPVGGVVITDNVSASGSAASLVFYEDTGKNPALRGMYVGYTITNNAATTSPDLWVKLGSFAVATGTARINLGLNEDGVQHIGPLAAGASMQVYFYLVDAGWHRESCRTQRNVSG